jgi:hypothetical protein
MGFKCPVCLKDFKRDKKEWEKHCAEKHLGSGTTGTACLNTGRKYILIEKDAGYCEIIKDRIANHEPLLQAVL